MNNNAKVTKITHSRDIGERFRILLALFAIYLIWGASYLVIKVGLQSFPPFLMAGMRFFPAGLILYLFLRSRGAPSPSTPQWIGASLVSGFLILGCGGGIFYAEQSVTSGVVAMTMATVPLWSGLFSGFWGHWPTRFEWLGMCLGLVGIVLLNLGGSLRANPEGGVILLLAAVSWAFGSVLSRYLPLPFGLMAGAVEMTVGGIFLIFLGLGLREKISSVPTIPSILAILYLLVLNSLVGFSAYNYLLPRVKLSLVNSFTYVNPLVAVALSVGLAGERISTTELISMLVIMSGIIFLGTKPKCEQETP